MNPLYAGDVEGITANRVDNLDNGAADPGALVRQDMLLLDQGSEGVGDVQECERGSRESQRHSHHPFANRIVQNGHGSDSMPMVARRS